MPNEHSTGVRNEAGSGKPPIYMLDSLPFVVGPHGRIGNGRRESTARLVNVEENLLAETEHLHGQQTTENKDVE
jgi:hypothetical protein